MPSKPRFERTRKVPAVEYCVNIRWNRYRDLAQNSPLSSAPRQKVPYKRLQHSSRFRNVRTIHRTLAISFSAAQEGYTSF